MCTTTGVAARLPKLFVNAALDQVNELAARTKTVDVIGAVVRSDEPEDG